MFTVKRFNYVVKHFCLFLQKQYKPTTNMQLTTTMLFLLIGDINPPPPMPPPPPPGLPIDQGVLALVFVAVVLGIFFKTKIAKKAIS